MFIALVYGWVFYSFTWTSQEGEGWRYVLSGDGKGYYAYLPKLFIDRDLTFTEAEQNFAAKTENGFINRFYCGTAILELPFFALAHLVASLSDYEANGYSLPYALLIGIAAIFYFLAGLYLLYKLLREKFQFTEPVTLWVIILIALGSNLMYYTTVKGSFSHVYSFFLINAFLYQLHRTSEAVSSTRLAPTSLLLGLIAVTRPVNLLVILLIPAFFKNLPHFFSFLKPILVSRRAVVGLLFGGIPLFIQCLLWYVQTGSWIQWSYKQEGFYFTNPQLSEVLFGFRRGLFIYAPLLLLTLLGWMQMFRKNRFQAMWTGLFFTAFVYVTASWWHWTYGDSFSIRPFVDITVVFALLLAFLLSGLSRFRFKLCLGIGVLLTLLQNVYAYQFQRKIIDGTTMSRDKFFSLFLQTSADYKNYYGGMRDLPPYAPRGFDTLHVFETSSEVFSKAEEWLVTSRFTYNSDEHVRHAWIEVEYERRIDTPEAMQDVLFVFHVMDTLNDTTKAYHTFRVKEYPTEITEKWHSVSHRLWLPVGLKKEDYISVYLWNRSREEFALNNYRVRVMVPRQK